MSHGKINSLHNFADRGREAIEFYKTVFGGDAVVTLVKDGGIADQMPAEWGERIMHLEFTAGDLVFYGSGIISDQAGKVPGNSFAIAIACDNDSQLRDLFTKLSAGGNVTLEPGPSPWGGLFGQCIDKFDISWMLDSNT